MFCCKHCYFSSFCSRIYTNLVTNMLWEGQEVREDVLQRRVKMKVLATLLKREAKLQVWNIFSNLLGLIFSAMPVFFTFLKYFYVQPDTGEVHSHENSVEHNDISNGSGETRAKEGQSNQQWGSSMSTDKAPQFALAIWWAWRGLEFNYRDSRLYVLVLLPFMSDWIIISIFFDERGQIILGWFLVSLAETRESRIKMGSKLAIKWPLWSAYTGFMYSLVFFSRRREC